MNGTYYIKINKDEDLMDQMRNFAQQNNTCGYFSGIGAAESVIISTYIPEKKDFLDHTKEGMLEMFSLSGNISLDKLNKYIVHAHAGFSYLNDNQEIAIIAGDLREARIGYTAEIVFTPTSEDLLREFDSKAEIEVWKLD